jgi:hypothetical protein
MKATVTAAVRPHNRPIDRFADPSIGAGDARYQPPSSPRRIDAWAAATRATGTRNGEHDT